MSESIVEEEDGEGEEALRESGIAAVDDLPWRLALLVRVRACEVEPELVGEGFVEEVGEAAEGLDLVELVLDEAVSGLDVGLVGVGAGRDGVVSGAGVLDGPGEGAVVLGVPGADELRAVVGLEAATVELDAAGGEVLGEPFDPEGRVSQGAFEGVGEELRAADDITGGVLHEGQTMPLDLRPQLGDVVEVLGVDVDLLEQLPPLLDLP